MCAIAGFTGSGDSSAIRAMINRLAHRGPDGEGVYEDTNHSLYLAHKRLAVVDIVNGAQPMWDSEHEICIIFNGEIYNHRDLRKSLEDIGVRFQTSHSDTEVLIYGYRQWGVELFSRLNGMFALCLYDKKRAQLVLARDRMGEKPLYYVDQGSVFAFASEVDALFAHPGIFKRLDPAGIQKFFAYGYAPGASSVFVNVRKLGPGEFLIYNLRKRTSQHRKYFTFRIEPSVEQQNMRDEDLAEELRDLVDRAVALRLQADVPVGLFLSGGIDSSAILSSATSHHPVENIAAFTIGFREASFDESQFARIAASHASCRHHCREVTVDSAKSLAGPIFRHLGEPFGDASILPTFILSGFAKERVTVALSGDGGDELFAGYDPFLALVPARF
jgi:asparagine synthase (glutamine-hydrolysing)